MSGPKALIEDLYHEALQAEEEHWRWLQSRGEPKRDIVRSYIKACQRTWPKEPCAFCKQVRRLREVEVPGPHPGCSEFAQDYANVCYACAKEMT